MGWCAGGTRTPTPLLASGPKPGASTNFATRAGGADDGPMLRDWRSGKPGILAARRGRDRPLKAAAGVSSSSGDNHEVGIDHYENFPVASWLCPKQLRPPIDRDLPVRPHRRRHRRRRRARRPEERLADLAAFRADLTRGRGGRPPSPRWPEVFGPLSGHRAHRLPRAAARRPARRVRAGRRQDALRRPHRAARLLPPLGQPDRPPAAAPVRRRRRGALAAGPTPSAARCSSTNFWQDLGVDAARGRCYVPERRRHCHGVGIDALLARRDGDSRPRRLVAELVAWARQLMLSGAPLVTRSAGRAGLGASASSCRAGCASSRRSTAWRHSRRRCTRAPAA